MSALENSQTLLLKVLLNQNSALFFPTGVYADTAVVSAHCLDIIQANTTNVDPGPKLMTYEASGCSYSNVPGVDSHCN